MPLPARFLAARAAARRAAVLLIALAALAAAGAGPALAAPGDPLASSGPADGARLTAGADPGCRRAGPRATRASSCASRARPSPSTRACGSAPRSPRRRGR